MTKFVKFSPLLLKYTRLLIHFIKKLKSLSSVNETILFADLKMQEGTVVKANFYYPPPLQHYYYYSFGWVYLKIM